MNNHQEILAKSEQNGRICLYQHLKNVADIACVMAKHMGLDEQVAMEGAVLHDIGKARRDNMMSSCFVEVQHVKER